VKTEWRGESLGWYDGGQLVGAGLVLHRPVPRLERFTLAYLPEGPVIDWTGEIDVWLDPLAARLGAQGAFAVRLGPPRHGGLRVRLVRLRMMALHTERRTVPGHLLRFSRHVELAGAAGPEEAS